ncbi:transcriptional regulator, MarR family [Mycolicibacterium canariasense]|uniref:Transcriptional regulator, MarR family n=1 Tax=Mycolicibacterium canariasense TaxID=228230 RepID=A0A117IBZ0_MYCCR|nr:MarR family transcriptional regulator [Mycolicibacterium canariasense]MCV7212119.1 MarR family transcriptional regulator [Mycolicibacterium canariasense]ORU95245.1 MarR family transcriptional regulator [Mycolicibacterium canariasense]GAS98612.1 transcriptional regulator, MarR family [Mycolicibacterium canariasense]
MSAPLYTPGTAGAADLAARTVGRQALLARLTQRIGTAATDGSRPHTLLVGPRGSGKTHTVRVALYRTLTTHAEHILPLVIPEDALAIGSYADLLVELLRTHRADANGLRDDVVELERTIVEIADGRMVLVVIENLDRVFDAIGEAGQGSLRAWVETSTAVTIFATAPTLFPGVSSRTHPWYGSFIIEHLDDLSVQDGAQIVARTARDRGDDELAGYACSPDGLHRLTEIAAVTGGAPRMWRMVGDVADRDGLAAVTPVLTALLDRLTPVYQHRLWGLPAGEQRLVVEIARGDGPRTVSDLAAAVGVSSQTASAALGRLVAARWVTAAKSDTGDRRATWYDLTEPLVRHVLRYREGQPPTP